MSEPSWLPFKPTRPPPLGPTSSPVSLSFPLDPSHPSRSSTIVITLSNPSKLNSVGKQDISDLISSLEWIAEQDQISITILTAVGRFFSAGADISDPARDPGRSLSEHTDPPTPAIRKELQDFYTSRLALGNGRLARELTFFPKLLIGALNGPAIGIMAAAISHCDLLYAYENFYLQVSFTSLGLVVEGLATQTFVAKMGLGRAQECLLEGRHMDAPTLAHCGFLTRLLPWPTAKTSSAGNPTGDSSASPSPSPSLSPAEEAAKKWKSGDKDFTLPILSTVLDHVKEKYLPPHGDLFALTYSKRIIQQVTYDHLDREAANQVELRGAEKVFTSGIPLRQFAELAKANASKKSKM